MSNHPEQQFLNLLQRLLDEGDERQDRTGVGTRALFGQEMRFDLSKGFPAFTTKKVFWKTAFKEILWMLSGGRNIRELVEQNVHIWSDWPYKKFIDAQEEGSKEKSLTMKEFEKLIVTDKEFAKTHGDLGPVYGYQWRHWQKEDGTEVDQIQELIDGLKNDPTSRRLLFEGWNVGQLDQMALPPCHKTYQFFVNQTTKTISGFCHQRSCDSFLGLSFNIVNGALITHLLAEQCGYEVGEFIWYGGDVHLYSNHIEQAKLQLTREPRPFPKLVIKRKPDSIFDYTIDDLDLEGYDPHPHIAGEVAV